MAVGRRHFVGEPDGAPSLAAAPIVHGFSPRHNGARITIGGRWARRLLDLGVRAFRPLRVMALHPARRHEGGRTMPQQA